MNVDVNKGFWRGKRVFLTGHTGFKGSWLALWLDRLGAKVTGYALPPSSDPSLFDLTRAGDRMRSRLGDLRSYDDLRDAITASRPEVVFHLAAQSLVRASYADPRGTYTTNVMGTVNVLEASRDVDGLQAIVVVTSDKCYENRGTSDGFREGDPLGGSDPYSSSKAAAELVTAAYRESFFRGKVPVASARAGNVIGGGDWAEDRLIPDIIRALGRGEAVRIRNPHATRPWQHVLDPLHGYLLLAERMAADERFASAWNFGPASHGEPVMRVVERVIESWGSGSAEVDRSQTPHEAATLHVDSTKARQELGWMPRLTFEQSLDWTVRWYRELANGTTAGALVERDLAAYEALLDG